MMTAHGRTYTSAPTDGSRTITLLDSQPRPEDDTSQFGVVGTLRLRGQPRKARQRVAWDEDVIDNEGCGKKKSKICCIYHKPRRFDESSEEESSGSDSDSDCQHSSCPRQTRMHHPEGNINGVAMGGTPNRGVIHEVEEAGSSGNAYDRTPKTKK
ncbi:phosphatase inhibitor-domain-containing protein [Suillus spraguei]|nr:phosphatase inhibitor-domain-containing protein [Suillus spraguei]